MFQLTAYHIPEFEEDTVEEFIEIAQGHGLTVVSQEWDDLGEQTIIVLQGSKEDFFSWNDEMMEGGPSWNEEEFMEDLHPVQAA
jgi:hypothetical protein